MRIGWLQSGCDWGRSTIVANSIREKSSRKRGKHCLKTFKTLREQFGTAVAKQIRDRKKQLQESKKPEEEDWWKKHPDCPDVEELTACHA